MAQFFDCDLSFSHCSHASRSARRARQVVSPMSGPVANLAEPRHAPAPTGARPLRASNDLQPRQPHRCHCRRAPSVHLNRRRRAGFGAKDLLRLAPARVHLHRRGDEWIQHHAANGIAKHSHLVLVLDAHRRRFGSLCSLLVLFGLIGSKERATRTGANLIAITDRRPGAAVTK